MLNQFFKITVNKIFNLNREGDKKSFSIEFSLDNNYVNTTVLDFMFNSNSEEIFVSGNIDILNAFAKNQLTGLLQKKGSLDKLEIFSENGNLTSLNFSLEDSILNNTLDWNFIYDQNPIEHEEFKGFYFSNYFDIKFLDKIFSMKEDLLITNLLLYVETIVLNRFFHSYLLIQNAFLLKYSLKEENRTLYEKDSLSTTLKINNRNIKIEINNNINQNSFLLDLSVEVYVDNKLFSLVELGSKLSLTVLEELLKDIYSTNDLKFVNLYSNNRNLRKIKNQFAIMLPEDLKENDSFIYEPLNSFYIDSNGFLFQLDLMEMEEVFTIQEVNSRILTKILYILK